MVKIWYSKVLERKIVTHFTTIPEQRLDYGEILSNQRKRITNNGLWSS